MIINFGSPECINASIFKSFRFQGKNLISKVVIREEEIVQSGKKMNYEFISNIHENSELKDAKRKHINCFKKRRRFQICQSGKDQKSLYYSDFPYSLGKNKRC